MDNGKSYKIGVNVLWHAEVGSRISKDSVFLPKMGVNLVKEVKFWKKLVMNKNVQKNKSKMKQLRRELNLKKCKFFTDHNAMNYAN